MHFFMFQILYVCVWLCRAHVPISSVGHLRICVCNALEQDGPGYKPSICYDLKSIKKGMCHQPDTTGDQVFEALCISGQGGCSFSEKCGTTGIKTNDQNS